MDTESKRCIQSNHRAVVRLIRINQASPCTELCHLKNAQRKLLWSTSFPELYGKLSLWLLPVDLYNIQYQHGVSDLGL